MVSIAILFSVLLWQSSNPLHIWLKAIILSIPLSLAYYLLILPEIPGLWISIPLFLIISGFTLWYKSKVFSGVVSALIAILIGLLLIPKIVASNLTNTTEGSAPLFTIENILTDSDITNESLLGKVVILDFFGTWCAPCIKEMAELKEIKEELASDNFVFVIACIQTAGDTPEKAIKFHKKRNLPFTLGFDYDSKAHKSFKFSGVPGLVILDKNGNIRLKHEGYNEAENLKATLLPILKQLENE